MKKVVKFEDIAKILPIFVVIFIGSIIPTVYYKIPHGSDTYTHLFYTKIMSESDSLEDFYKNLKEKFFSESGYPFGFWLFGSIIVKITNISYENLPFIVPLILLIFITIMYYCYSYSLLKNEKLSIFSTLFMLTTPVVAIGILNYETDVFMFVFLIFLFYFLNREDNRSIFLQSLVAFLIPIVHAGTLIFLLSFYIIYLIVYTLFMKRVSKVIIPFSILLLSLNLNLNLFPEIHQQYIDKGRLISAFPQKISDITHIIIFGAVGNYIYTNLFLKPDISVTMSFIATIYIFLIVLKKISSKFSFKLKKKIVPFPIFLSERVPHSIAFWPFWLGPIQTLLAVFGIKKINKKILLIAIPLLVTTIPSGYMAGVRGLREIQYLVLVLPIISSLGVYTIISTLDKKIKGELKKKIIVNVGIFLLFIYFVTLPVVGNMYYHPKISGTESEVEGLKWLKNIGHQSEGVAGLGYRHRISVYADKIPPASTWIPYGKEMRRFLENYEKVCYFADENSAKDLFGSFGVNYIIISNRTFKFTGKSWEDVKISRIKYYDKIYSSEDFEIYKYILEPILKSEVFPAIQLETSQFIKDAGSFFVVETPKYKMRIGKNTPIIDYFGTKSVNFLGDGRIGDFINILTVYSTSLQEINYEKTVVGRNIIEYYGKIENHGETLGSVKIVFTFYQNSFKKDIIFYNDYKSIPYRIHISTSFFIPTRKFVFEDENGIKTFRNIYPNEDYVLLEDKEFRRMFIYSSLKEIRNGSGIFIEIEDKSPYPDIILYSGSTTYKNYSLIKFTVRRDFTPVKPGESIHIVQWYSIGEYENSKSNVQRSNFVDIYPYQDGILPVTFIIELDNRRHQLYNKTYINKLKSTINFLEENGVKGALAIPLVYNDDEARQLLVSEDIADFVNAQNFDIVFIKSRYYKKLSDEEFISTIKNYIDSINKFNRKSRHNYGIYAENYSADFIYMLSNITNGENNAIYIVNKKIFPPYYDLLFDEGVRIPSIAFYKGYPMNVAIFSASMPVISKKNFEKRNLHAEVFDVIRIARKHNEYAVFIVDADSLLDNKFLGDLVYLIKEMNNSAGITFVKPSLISEYTYRLYNSNLRITVKGEYPNNITIEAKSQNNIRGFTMVVRLPRGEYEIGGAVRYRIEGGLNNMDTYYITLNLYSNAKNVVHIKRT